MRTFLAVIFSLQCLLSLGPISQAQHYATMAKVSHTPATLALMALIMLLVLAFCMLYGGVSQTPIGKKPAEPKPDNAHGGWWNLGRVDVVIITILLLGVCSYGLNFSKLSYYMLPDSYMRPLISLHELPGIILMNSGIWAGAFGAVFMLSLLVRLCLGGKPGGVTAASITALVALVGMLFIAVVLSNSVGSGMLDSPGSLYACICTICCYKAVRCVSLRCLLPEWAGGRHEGGATPAEESLPVSDLNAEAEESTEPALQAQIAAEAEATTPQLSPAPQMASRPVPPVLQVAPQASRPQRTEPQLTPAPQAPALPHVRSSYIGYIILALLAVGSSIVMAEWADKELRGISSGEGCVFGILFGLSLVPFGLFVADAFRKAFREYRAERAEKAVPYAVLIVLALGLWYVLFYGLAKLMD